MSVSSSDFIAGTISPLPHRCKESEEQTERAAHLLGQVKTGVDHLADKLQHIKAVSQLIQCV